MLGINDYPLSSKKDNFIHAISGKSVEEITMQNILSEEVGLDDLRISPETLEYQAQIAESAGNFQLAGNLRRAGELTKIPDEKVIELYNALRPYRSTKDDLLGIANYLEETYHAKICADFIREAVSSYEKGNMFKKV